MQIRFVFVCFSFLCFSCLGSADVKNLQNEKTVFDTTLSNNKPLIDISAKLSERNIDSTEIRFYEKISSLRRNNLFVSDEEQTIFINDKNFTHTFLPQKGDTLVAFTARNIFTIKVTQIYKETEPFETPPAPNAYGFSYDSLCKLNVGSLPANYPFEIKLFCKYKHNFSEIRILDTIEVKSLFERLGEKKIRYFNSWEDKWKTFSVNFRQGGSNYFKNGIVSPIWVCRIGDKSVIVVQVFNEEYSQLHYYELSNGLGIKLLYIPYMA